MEEDDYDYDEEGNLIHKPKTENHDELPTEHHEVPTEHHEVPPEHHEVPVAHDTKPDTGVPSDHGLPNDHGLPKGEKGLPEHVSPQDVPHNVPVGEANHNENPQAPSKL